MAPMSGACVSSVRQEFSAAVSQTPLFNKLLTSKSNPVSCLFIVDHCLTQAEILYLPQCLLQAYVQDWLSISLHSIFCINSMGIIFLWFRQNITKCLVII